MGRLILILATTVVSLSPGCSQRPADQTPLAIDPGEEYAPAGMDDQGYVALEQVFADLGGSHNAAASPAQARSPRGRWSDVHLAVLYACDDSEMAVVGKTVHSWGWEYQLRTTEDWPVRLSIQRVAGAEVYNATASVGRFGDHSDRSARLIEAFEKQMADFGRKRKYPDPIDNP
jgi:hypothetical protein